ncbi:hypothetical protein OG272_16125 [Streptomyces sp. NBC_00104]|uniref:hypothetical protein n=1 Tax=Streptomyces sp. NBC_00104 TaxID=2903621 RepID=UPI0032456B6B
MIGPATFPPGPTLAYVSTAETGPDATHRIQLVDLDALDDPRERALCRALLLHALALLDDSEPARTTAARADS